MWAPNQYLGSYRAWMIVQQIAEDQAKRDWVIAKNFLRTAQVWDEQDQSFAEKLKRVCGMEIQAVRDLYFSVATNHMGFWDGRGYIGGSGLFETLCFTNHSCAPNATVTPLSGRRGTALRAISAIKPGDEITWNYFYPNDFSRLPVADRRHLAEMEFGFVCQCVRCQREAEIC